MGGCSPRRCPSGSAPTSSATEELARRFAAAGRTLYLVGGSVRDALFPGRRPSRAPRLRPDHRRPPRRDRAARAGLGRRRLDPGGALRHHRLPQGRPGLRDHHPPGRGLRARLAQARGDLRRRHRRRPVAARLHHQRAGPAAARHGADRPLRRPRRPGRRPAAHAARPRDLLRRRPAAHAAGGPLRRPLLARARPRARRRGRGACTAACPSCRPSGSATSSTRSSWSTCPRAALWFVVRTGLADEFLPELPGLALEQDPIHRHKDVLAHTLAVVDKTSPGPPAAPGRAVPRRRQAAHAGHHRRRGDASTTTRWSGPA